jgi:hypothetical protein
MIFRAPLFSSIKAFQILSFIAVCVTLSYPSAIHAHWPSVELHALSRLGGSIGSHFEASVADGVLCEELDKLTFSNSDLIATPIFDSPSPFLDDQPVRTGRFQVSIPDSAVEGFTDIRVTGRFGLSNSRRFWITKEPWQFEPWKPTSSTNASELMPNVVRQDRFEPRFRNYYRLDIDSPKVIHIAILTNALDSQSELDLSLLGPDGRKIASLDSGHLDHVWSWKLLQAGTHTLVLNDRLFRGGNAFSYALLWKDGFESESNQLVDRWDLLVSKRLSARIGQDDSSNLETEQPNQDRTPFLYTNSSPKTLTLRPPNLNVQRIEHREADYSKNQACSVPIPCLIEGVFDVNLDEDWFEVVLGENELVVAEVVSERLGERTDPIVAAYRVSQGDAANEHLAMIVKADDLEVSKDPMSFSSRDPIAIIKASQPGKYRILVRDQQRISNAAERSRYALELRKPQPGFQLMAYWAFPGRDRTKAKAISPTLIQNGALALAVRAYRHDGWIGPIGVRVTNVPEIFQSKTLTLSPNQSIGHCIFDVNDERFESIPSLQVIGTASIDGEKIEQIAYASEYIWGPSETFRAPMVRLVDSIPLAFESRDKLPISIKLGGESSVKIQQGASVNIPIKLVRSENANQTVTVRLVDLPPSTKTKDLKIEADQDSGEVELAIPESMPIGDYFIWAQCETKITMPSNPQSLERAKQELSKLDLLQKESPDSHNDELKSVIKKLSDQVARLQESTKPKSFDVQLPSNQFLIQVVEKP